MGLDWLRGFKFRRPAASPAAARRWVVADVEASGLDARRDRLLAIAAVAVHFDAQYRRPQIVLADSFEVVIQQPLPDTHAVDKANILIHGIGVGQQRAGIPGLEALEGWRDYIGDAPLVGYHSAFDQTLIDRATRRYLGQVLPNPWLDLEPLAAVLHQDPRRRALDHWLDRYRIACLLRHQAAADTLATAELMLGLWPQVRQRVGGRFADVVDLAESAQFLAGR